MISSIISPTDSRNPSEKPIFKVILPRTLFSPSHILLSPPHFQLGPMTGSNSHFLNWPPQDFWPVLGRPWSSLYQNLLLMVPVPGIWEGIGVAGLGVAAATNSASNAIWLTSAAGGNAISLFYSLETPVLCEAVRTTELLLF